MAGEIERTAAVRARTRGNMATPPTRSTIARTGFFYTYPYRHYATIMAITENTPEAILQEEQRLMLRHDCP